MTASAKPLARLTGRLLFGPGFKQPSGYKSMLPGMATGIVAVWKDNTFLLFRICKLILAGLQFVFPYNWLCILAEAIGRRMVPRGQTPSDFSYKVNYAVSEIYILARIVVPVVLLVALQLRNSVWYWIILGTTIETATYVLGNVFIPARIGPASHSRAAFLLVIAFLGTSLSFAFLYWNVGGIKGLAAPTDAVYFSIVTAATVGYGDMHAITPEARQLVTLQILTSVFFLVSFFPVFFAKAVEETRIQKRSRKRSK